MLRAREEEEEAEAGAEAEKMWHWSYALSTPQLFVLPRESLRHGARSRPTLLLVYSAHV